MSAANEFRIEGAREMARVLRLLPDRIGRRVLIGALRTSAGVIRSEARRRAPVRAEAGLKAISKARGKTRAPGFLRKSIIVRSLRGGSKDNAAVMVGPSRDAFYGLMVELGTVHASPHPFLRPAFDSRIGDAVDKLGTQLGKNIERAAARLAGPLARSGLVRRRRR